MFEKVANEQWSGRRIYLWLKNDLKFKTITGKHLSLSNIFIILQKTFYYGTFEYPVGSGNWYTGNHVPIITKELFDRTREQMKRSEVKNDKEFAFTKLITCGLCGSGITASERWKYQQNGNTHRYVYYGCTKKRDVNCPCGYIKEEEIIEQIVTMLDALDINELGIKQKFKDEIVRYNKFRKIALGRGKEQHAELEIFNAKSYAVYILTEGTITEKRELLSNLKSRLMLKNRILSVVSPEAA